jgi:hypothetical protein
MFELHMHSVVHASALHAYIAQTLTSVFRFLISVLSKLYHWACRTGLIGMDVLMDVRSMNAGWFAIVQM